VIRLAVVSVAGLALFLALGAQVDTHPFLPGDRAAFDALDHLRTDWGVDVVAVLTDLGSSPVTGALVLFTGLRARPRAQGIALIAGMVILVLAVTEAKVYFDRPRPAGMLVHAAGLSYPSGHAAYATAWVACALTAGGGRLLVAGAAGVMVAVMASRVYLHVHYLSDTIGGAALGVAVFAGCALAARAAGTIRDNRSEKP
jgi:membrane-associated phospholipid phosphatase